MAKYSAATRNKNRRTIAKATLFVLGILVLLAATMIVSNRTAFGLGVVVLLFAATFWWAFAGVKSGTIDGSWVDGWNFGEGSENPDANTFLDPNNPTLRLEEQERRHPDEDH